MLNLKKLLTIGSIAMITLSTGCATQIDQNTDYPVDGDNNAAYVVNMDYPEGTVEPVLPIDYVQDIIANEDQEIYQKVYDTYGFFDGDTFSMIGETLPDITLTDYNGRELKLSDLKGRRVVFEFMASWCDYCRQTTKEVFEDYMKNHTDTLFVQVFVEGNKSDIDEFYESIDMSVGASEQKYVIAQSGEGSMLASALGVLSYPTILFVDETGTVQLASTGYYELDVFEKAYDLAYSYKILDHIDSDLMDRIKRDYMDVKNDLSEEVVKQLSSLRNNDTDSTMFDTVMYANMNQELTPDIEDIEGNIHSWDSLKNKNTIIFYALSSDDYYTKENLTLLKDFCNEKDYNLVVVLFPYQYIDDNTNYYEENKDIFENTIVIDSTGPISTDFYSTSLDYIPSTLFLDIDGRLRGGLAAELDASQLEKANEILFGETATYTQLKGE